MSRERMPECHDPDFWPFNFRKVLAAQELLTKKYLSLRSRGAYADALWEARCALDRAAQEYVRHAHTSGQLLRCFY